MDEEFGVSNLVEQEFGHGQKGAATPKMSLLFVLSSISLIY
uniref:Uncharacterized protein n=1 Tax=Anguilla anguilla TaxID=7936 RepID=A0A0E9P8J7_ANGAN